MRSSPDGPEDAAHATGRMSSWYTGIELPGSRTESVPRTTAISYKEGGFAEEEIVDVAALSALAASDRVVWVNVEGISNVRWVFDVGEAFGVHWLALRSIVHTAQRPEFRSYGEHILLTARMVTLADDVDVEQVAFLLGQRCVLTFQERSGDCFDRVREELRRDGSKLRSTGADRLVHALLDSTVESQYPVIEHFDMVIEELEAEAIKNPTNTLMATIQEVKNQILTLRRAVLPTREMVADLLREDTQLMTRETKMHFRASHQTTGDMVEMLDSYREMAGGLIDVFMLSVSNRTNQVMRLLTIFTAVFAPLTLIAAIYGMRFEYVPELSWPFGRALAIAFMVLIGSGVLSFFSRKGWL